MARTCTGPCSWKPEESEVEPARLFVLAELRSVVGLNETLERGDQFVCSLRFCDDTFGSKQSRTGSSFVLVDGEEQDFGGRRDSPDFLCGLNPIHNRHLDIEKNHFGP
jgi:hypothetical protein